MQTQVIKSPLDEKILNPLLACSGLTAEDQQTVREALSRIIISEILLKIIQTLPKEKLENIEREFREKSPKQRLKILQDVVKNSPEAQKAVKEYTEKDLWDFSEKILNAFLEKATPEQRKKFFTLAGQVKLEKK